jgi:Flp pilus assembly protein TadD
LIPGNGNPRYENRNADAIDPAFDHVNAGFAAYQADQYTDAESHYRAALRIDRNHRYALAGLAAVLQKTGRADESRPLYEKLLDIDPADTAAAAELLSGAADITGREREADLKLLLQRHPNVAQLHFALGMHYSQTGQWPEARRAFMEAQTLSPQNAVFNYNLAVSLEHLGLTAEARRFYETVLAIPGDDPAIDRQLISQRLDRMLSGRQDPG